MQAEFTPYPTAPPDYGLCWLAPNKPDHTGYAWQTVEVGQPHVRAHRHALALALGRPLLLSEMACHTCDVRNCVRNDEAGIYLVDGTAYLRFGHLWVGDGKANMADARAKQRLATGDRHPTRLRPELVMRGEANGNAVFTATDILTMRRLAQLPEETNVSIAARFHCDPVTVGYIVTGRSWRHIGGPLRATAKHAAVDDALVQAVLAEYRPYHVTITELAAKYGRDRTVIWRIIRQHLGRMAAPKTARR